MNDIEKSVYIILLNYNGYNDTIECLKSLRKISYKNYKIIVVDNKSSDNSIYKISKYIEDEDKDIVLLQSNENNGFSAGNNIGIKYALEQKCDYVCLLNNDTIVEKDFLNELVQAMENDNTIGISSGKIMYHSNPDKIWFAGGYINKTRTVGFHFGMDELDSEEFNQPKYVDFITGCLQLIRTEVFDEIGLYDEEYFLYMEDVDFSYRASQKGYKLRYIPKSKIYHKVSASTGGNTSKIVIYYMSRNRLLFNRLHESNGIYNLILYLSYVAKIFIKMITGKEDYRYVIKAIIDDKKRKYGRRDI